MVYKIIQTNHHPMNAEQLRELFVKEYWELISVVKVDDQTDDQTEGMSSPHSVYQHFFRRCSW